MDKNNYKVSAEYKNKNTITPFETYLKYTSQKKESAIQLAAILGNSGSSVGILDIGTGNGEYLKYALEKIKDSSNWDLTLIEPSDDLATQLDSTFSERNTNIVHTDFDSFSSNERFDIVLASHLFYHIPKQSQTEQLTKMLSLLKTNGTLIIVLRDRDDAYEFKMQFKPLLLSSDFKAMTIDDVLNKIPNMDKLNIERRTVTSKLTIPITQNQENALSIIEFYLGKKWEDIPELIKEDIFSFIMQKNNTFELTDGIAVITKSE